jgi:hypothetical protein
MRRCAWCQVELEGMRRDARYCSTSCRVMASRARRRQERLLTPLAPLDALQSVNPGLQGVNSAGSLADDSNRPRPPDVAQGHAHVARSDFTSSAHRVDARTGTPRSPGEESTVRFGETVGCRLLRPDTLDRTHEQRDTPKDF